MGPNSREILQGLTESDLSNDKFPFATYQKNQTRTLRNKCH